MTDATEDLRERCDLLTGVADAWKDRAEAAQRLVEAWRERALTAEAMAHKLGEPVAWQWRRKGEPWQRDFTFLHEVHATTEDSEVRALYAPEPKA